MQVKCQRAFTNRKKEFPLLTDYVSVLENIGDRANTALEQMEIYQVQDLLENLAHNFEKVWHHQYNLFWRLSVLF